MNEKICQLFEFSQIFQPIIGIFADLFNQLLEFSAEKSFLSFQIPLYLVKTQNFLPDELIAKFLLIASSEGSDDVKRG